MSDADSNSDKHAAKKQKTIGDFFKKGTIGIQRETRKRRNLTASSSEPEVAKRSKPSTNVSEIGDCTTTKSVGDLRSVEDGLNMCEAEQGGTTTGETSSHHCDGDSKTVMETAPQTDTEVGGDSQDVIPSSQRMPRTNRLTLTGARKKSPAKKSPARKFPTRISPVRSRHPEKPSKEDHDETRQTGACAITNELDRLSVARKLPARKSPVRSQHGKEPPAAAAAAAAAEGDRAELEQSEATVCSQVKTDGCVAEHPVLTHGNLSQVDIEDRTYETHRPKQLHTPVKLNILPKNVNIDKLVSGIDVEQCQQKIPSITTSAGSVVGTSSVSERCVENGSSSDLQSKTGQAYETANVTDWTRPATAATTNSANRSRHNISDSEDDFDSDLDEVLAKFVTRGRKSRSTYGQKGGLKDRTRDLWNASRADTVTSSRNFGSTSAAGLRSSLSQNPRPNLRLSRSDLSGESTQPYSQTENSDDYRPSGIRSLSRQTSQSDTSSDIRDHYSPENIDADIRSPAVTSRPSLHSLGCADRSSSCRYKNIEFYSNAIPSVPDGAKIDVMLREWKGNYSKLEIHHGYIQWLFPLRESGLNMLAQPLMAEEAEFLRTDRDAQKRLLSAYRMMLDFYGLELVDDKSGKIQRASNWQDRLSNLNRSSHNYLRITRILKCFGEVGLEHLQGPLVSALIHEAFVAKTLVNAQRSCRTFWIPSVDDPDHRQKLKSYLPSFY